MKADYLQFIYECLSGEDGCLAFDGEQQNYQKEFDLKLDSEIGAKDDDEFDDVPLVWYDLQCNDAF